MSRVIHPANGSRGSSPPASDKIAIRQHFTQKLNQGIPIGQMPDLDAEIRHLDQACADPLIGKVIRTLAKLLTLQPFTAPVSDHDREVLLLLSVVLARQRRKIAAGLSFVILSDPQ